MPRSFADKLLVLVPGLLVALSGMAAAQTPKRVLYVTHVGPNSHAHTSRLHAVDVLTNLGQTSGVFTLTHMTDASQIDGATLAGYDAVIFFTAGELPWTPVQKASLLDYVRNGRSFIGVHSAANTFQAFNGTAWVSTWPDYHGLLGGGYADHPWTQLATIRVEDQTHPSTAHLGASFAINDEIYEVNDWSRNAVSVLLNVDTSSLPPDATPRPDNDYALAWTKTYGTGRVLYTGLGHLEAVWDDARFRQHILGAIRWALFDGDADGLDDRWEQRYGVSDRSASGVDGAAGDFDGDGLTNAQEQAAGTHPRGLHKRYLAEGATGVLFDTRVSLLNYQAALPMHARLNYLKESGQVEVLDVILPPHSQRGVRVADLPALADTVFSTTVESDVPFVAERTMTWSRAAAWGNHAESAQAGFAPDWYFAEGATHGAFDLFYLVQNPHPTPISVEATFLRGAGSSVVRQYQVGPNSRLTINVDFIPGLEASDVAAAFHGSAPIIVERAMYMSNGMQFWAGGHASAGVTSLNTRWFLAEGATGTFFDTFVLVGNPGNVDAALQVTYLKPDGTTVVQHPTVAARSRLTLNPELVPALAATSLSVVVESTNGVPIVVERAMWWPGPTAATWHEGHSTLATTEMGHGWALADGEVGGFGGSRTYVLVATGQSTSNDSLRLRVIMDSGQEVARIYPNVLTPNARLTFDMEGEFNMLAGHRFGVIVESLGLLDAGGPTPTAVPRMPIVVERAVYSDSLGLFWALGTNLVATKLF
jgi:type 1 glutamine amidotransferase